MISELVSEIRTVVDDARDHDDRSGYFAAMYLGVTTTVERGVRDGIFATPDRLSALTVTFARRYLDALERHHGGGQPRARSDRTSDEGRHDVGCAPVHVGSTDIRGSSSCPLP